MVRKSLIELAEGATISRDEMIGDVLRKWTYKASDLIAVGTKLLKPLPMSDLDIHFEFPTEIEATYPVAIGAIVPPQKLTWVKYGLTLEQAQVHIIMTDDAKLRGDSQLQNQMQMKRAAEALAKQKDAEIFEKIIAGAGATTVTAANKWNTAAGDPESDIIDAWNNILNESNVTEPELRKAALVVPTAVYGQLLKLNLIGNVQQSVKTYLKSTYGIEIYPTRDSQVTTDAWFLVTGGDTGVHGVLNTNKIPLTEKERMLGQGDRWLTKQFFKSKITPESQTVSTNYRIAKIATIL